MAHFQSVEAGCGVSASIPVAEVTTHIAASEEIPGKPNLFGNNPEINPNRKTNISDFTTYVSDFFTNTSDFITNISDLPDSICIYDIQTHNAVGVSCT